MSLSTSGPTLRSGRWSVDTRTSRAMFRVRDVLHKPVTGSVPVLSGSVEVDDHGSPIAVLAELDLAGVDTGNARRDRDLRGRRFFDVESSPRLVFRGGPGTARPDGGWLLPGVLGLRGTTCPLELVVVPVPDGPASRVRATGTVDRRQLGLRAPRLLVGSMVSLTVDAYLLPPRDHPPGDAG